MNKPTKFFATALVSGSVLLTAACGSSGRPSVNDIQKALTKSSNVFDVPSGTSSDVLKCVAQAVHDSGLSDNAVKAIVKGQQDYKPSAADEKAVSGLGTAIQKCQGK